MASSAYFVQRTERAPESQAEVVVAREVTADPTPAAEPAPAVESAPPQAQAAPVQAVGPAPVGQEPEELVKKLYDPLLRRLKAELWLDRERRGVLTDRWH
ncbi:hypothetical protein ACQPZF_30980 [Actinosynnema sp. CS-041913]|uniref:hypothetical protein n=1 Tax=Actinosynnema sp. CS-041913 TaxID=3239917 RepID=UPI003D901AFC